MLWLLLCVTLHSLTFAADLKEICPGIFLRGVVQRDFNDVEKRFFCGDKRATGPGSEAWREIPESQARYHLGILLQDRGHFQPLFSKEDGKLIIDPGPITRVNTIEAEGLPVEVELSRKRDLIGKSLTPAALDEVEAWVARELRRVGHLCPTVDSRADPQVGEVKLLVKPGPSPAVSSVIEEPIPGLAPGALGRFYAFNLGDPFNGDLLSLTARRVLSAGPVQDYSLSVADCDRGILKQGALAGPPKLLSFGFGANTEGLFLVRGGWRNTRLGAHASNFSVIAAASLREQSIHASADWYPAEPPSRYVLRPLILLERQNERPYEVLLSRVAAMPGRTWDGRYFHFYFRSGPAWDLIRTIEGIGPKVSRFYLLDTEVGVISHDFEIFETSPRSGFRLGLDAELSHRGLGSSATSERLGLSWEALWNLKNYDPPLWVFAIRGNLRSTLTPDSASELPPIYRLFLGGNASLRGFGRNELPRDVLGALTSWYTGLEARLVSVLPHGIQPFAFVDVGAIGREPAHLDSPVFWSPGTGVRWESPVGVFRGTVAHGFPGPDSHWQLYLSYGEEF